MSPTNDKLVIYNTLSRDKEPFVPIDPAHVRMYVCGPTVYDYVHIGNARPVVAFDVLYRLLKRRYPRVTYVRNITDIDDKIMTRAAGERRDDRCADRIAPPRPTRATWRGSERWRPTSSRGRPSYVGQMIALIERLVARGHAYAAEGHVLFSVPSMRGLRPAVAPLARRADRRCARRGGALQEGPGRLRAVEAVDRDAAGLGEPWGRGRPGWHIECSAMSAALSRRDVRHPCRRHRPDLPAPRERDRAEPLGVRPRHHGELLDAQRLAATSPARR